jgi:hypothetical protein
MKTSHPSLRSCLIVALLSSIAAGCAGPSTTGITHVKRPIVAAEYEQVYFTGSHIPVLVPKDPNVRRVPTISPLVIMTPDEMQRSVGPTFPMH